MRVLSRGFIFIVGILFALLMAAVYTATLFLDRNIDNIFENYAHWSSGGYYAVAILILLLVIKAAELAAGGMNGSKLPIEAEKDRPWTKECSHCL